MRLKTYGHEGVLSRSGSCGQQLVRVAEASDIETPTFPHRGNGTRSLGAVVARLIDGVVCCRHPGGRTDSSDPLSPDPIGVGESCRW